MSEIRLSTGDVCLIDDGDVGWVSQHRWGRMGWKGRYVARTATVNGKKTTIYLHRVLAGLPGLEVDHINGDPLDNRRANLRPATRSQNEQNKQDTRLRASSGLRGVWYDKRRGRFVAGLHVNGRKISLGSYASASEADVAAREGRRRLMTHAPECLEDR
jgi:hypothetical protein